MVVRALTKRRPAPCLHPRVLPTPAHSLRPPSPSLPLGKGEEKPELLRLWLLGKRKERVPARKGCSSCSSSLRAGAAGSRVEAEPSQEESRAAGSVAGGEKRNNKKKSLAAALLPPPSPGKGAEEAGLPATSEEAGTES